MTAPAGAAWAGHDGDIAVRIGNDWHFVTPRAGMALFDQSAAQTLVFRSQWEQADAPAAPAGGIIVDVQARAAIAGLIQSLVALGILGLPGA